jgi:hypothetical protein
MSEPTTVRTLEAALASLDLEEPENDAERCLAAGDTRIIGIYGYSVSFPGIPDVAWMRVIAEETFRAVEGTSDCVIGERHMALISVASNYAERYNRHLWQQHAKTSNQAMQRTAPRSDA